MAKINNKSYPLGRVIKKMIQNLNEHNKVMYFYFAIFTITTTIYPLCIVILPKLLIQELSLGVSTNLQNIIKIVLGYFIVAGILGFIKVYIKSFTVPRITLLRIDYIRDMIDKVASFSYKYIEDAEFMEENSKAFEAVSGNDGVEKVYTLLFETPSIIIITLSMIFIIGNLNILILLGMFLNLSVMLIVNKIVQKYRYKRKRELAHFERRNSYYYRTTHDFAFGKDIRVFDFKDRILQNYSNEINGYIAIIRKIKNKEFLFGFFALTTLLISDILTYGILIYNTVNGMSIADFSMYLAAIGILSTNLMQLVGNLTIVYTQGQYINDFYNFMEADYGEKGGDIEEVNKDALEIEFKNVSFKYPNTDIYIIKNLNLKIHKGERLAIVGVNGAGKTTLVKLMTGLFDVTEGEILINGTPINKFSKKALYSMFSVVFQEINISAFTIKENIACTSENIDEEKIWNCLERVGLKDKIASIDRGIDHMMLKVIEADGIDLSGGERQKLAIARALYKDANMVIMDEPTAALDALAEAEIYNEFENLIKGKTAVYISHRLASTKFCDKIALFDNNGLCEYGNHEELMQKRGKYYEMFSIQGKYYKEGAVSTNE